MTMQPSAQLMIEFLGTPEAGKTSLIHRLEEELSKSYKVGIVQEAAELVPENIPKKSLEKDYWIKCHTIIALLEAKYQLNNDICLIDRGLIDMLFWNYYYFAVGGISKRSFETHKDFLLDVCVSFPNIVVVLSTTPEEAIRRRGGEGRLVTIEYVRTFNQILSYFIAENPYPFYQLDTTGLSKEDKFDKVFKQISRKLHLP